MGAEVGTSGIVLVYLLVIARFVGGGHGGFAAFFNAGVHTVKRIKNFYEALWFSPGDVPLLFPLGIWTENAALSLVEKVGYRC